MKFLSSAKAQTNNQDDSKILINVIVKQAPDSKVVGTVPSLPELYVEANTAQQH